MRKVGFICLAVAGALVLGAFASVPASAMVDRIDKLVPAETQAAAATGERFVATPSTAYLDVAESQKVDTGGQRFEAQWTRHDLDVAEAQNIDRAANTTPVTAKKQTGEKCSGC